MTNTTTTGPGIASPTSVETWPLAVSAPWQVIAWPDWQGPEVQSVFDRFGTDLAKKHACLCLVHDSQIDGPLEYAMARLEETARGNSPGQLQPRVAIIGKFVDDAEWQAVGSSMHAKICSLSPKPSARSRIDDVPALELRTGSDVQRLLVPEPVLEPLDEYRKRFAGVRGWFKLPAIALWDSLLTLQAASGVSGNFFEIGVWMGRSALLSALHASSDEQCVFTDLRFTEQTKANLQSVRRSGLHFLQTSSRNLVPAMLPGSDSPKYRWVHIDGDHSGFAVQHDLALAAAVLGERGIIVVDDFFDPSYPQITFAVIDYLRSHSKSLMMFLCGYGKGYLCHPSDGRWLLQYVAERLTADMTRRGAPAFTIFKTADPLDLNCFGIGPRGVNEAFRGPDSEPELIRY